MTAACAARHEVKWEVAIPPSSLNHNLTLFLNPQASKLKIKKEIKIKTVG